MAEPNFIRRFFDIANGNDHITLASIIAIIIILTTDVSLARVYDLVLKQPTSVLRLIIFSILTTVCIVALHYVLQYAERRTSRIGSGSRKYIRAVRYIARISQYAITTTLAILVYQTVFILEYNTLLMIAIVWISYGLAILMLALLAQRFFSWSATNRSVVTILYGLAAASLAANFAFSLFYVNDVLSDRRDVTMPFSAGSMVSITPNSERAILNSGFFVSSIISFVLLWGATAVLLYHYSHKIGPIRFWLVISSPLVFFLGQFASVYIRLFDPLLAVDAVSYSIVITLIFTLSKPIGGILFGIAFYTVARHLGQNVLIRNYLIISALGFVLLYVADHASALLVAPFPPFGIGSVSFVGIASYLIFLGIYSSVISISEDAKLRRMIRKSTVDQSRFFDSMTSAHINEEIKKKVGRIVRDYSEKIAKATGTDQMESEEEVKKYLDEVLKELGTTPGPKRRGDDAKENFGNE